MVCGLVEQGKEGKGISNAYVIEREAGAAAAAHGLPDGGVQQLSQFIATEG